MAGCEELVESGGAEEMPRVVAALAGILERVAERNDAAELSAVAASAFRTTTKPGISVRAYMARIARFAGCSPACYVVAHVYLDRLLRRGRRLALAVDSYSVHRLLITAVLAAVKFMDDICYNNAYFAKVGGISLAEMNYLEVDFLFGVGFDLNVAPETFADYCAVLQSELLCAEAPPPPPLRLQHCCLSDDDAGAGCSAQQQLAA
ncbi:cyclin-P4-1-like [Panicum miliaceum]|uniref:Cyclin n=1 Tax=Panicum miliaceum TaxID=4540 RepID=A0A3L6RS65_PANMI|nr:cyclin-P4-1-like [Panicum miliaceum]